MGSHIACCTVTVLHISECWPEDGLIRPKYVATVKFLYLYTVVVF